MKEPLHHSIKGSGSPLLLLHPVGLDSKFWGSLVARAAEIHTVVTVDLLGHGQSAVAKSDRGITAYAEDIKDLIEHLGFGSVSVLGLSFGGMIAQEFVLKNAERTALLIVGACGGRITPELRDAVRNRGKTDPATGMASVVDTTIDRWFTPGFMQAPIVQRVRERLLANDPDGWAAGWNAIAGFDAYDRLASIKTPTLVVAGEQDAGTPVAATKAVADAIPGAEFTVFPKAPHMMQIECEDRFVDRLIDFLRNRKDNTNS